LWTFPIWKEWLVECENVSLVGCVCPVSNVGGIYVERIPMNLSVENCVLIRVCIILYLSWFT
jgi:hypothetical protein